MDPAAQALIARLQANPNDLEAYESLKAHYHYANDFASLANLVEGFAAMQPDPALAAAAYHESARTVSYYLDDQARAIELLETALDRVPDFTEALTDLDQLLEATGEVQRRVTSLERRANRLSQLDVDPAAIAAIHYQLGELWEKSLERIDKAVIHYRSAYELDPEHLPAMYAAREIFRRSGDVRTAARVYDLEIGAEKDPVRAVMLLRELSVLRRDSMSDTEGGIRALERALGIAPRDTEVAYELAGVLLARAAATQDPAVATADRKRAASLLVSLAEVAEGDGRIAFLESALDSAPDSEEALLALEAAVRGTPHEARLAIRYLHNLAAAPDGPRARDRRVYLASAYAAAGQANDAIALLEPLANRGDGDVDARLLQLYEAAGRTDDVAKMRRASFDALPREQRLALLEGELAAASAGSDAHTAAVEGILALDPAHAGARAARVASMRARGDHAGLRDHLLTAGADDGRSALERAEAWKEIAALAEGPLADAELATRARTELLALSPGDRDARAKLKQTMRLAQRWSDLAGILVWEATQDEDTEQRRSAALSLDELTERASLDPTRAIEALQSVSERNPDDVAIRDKLLARLLAAGRFRDALPLVERKAETAPTTHDAAKWLSESARIREELGDLVGAHGVLTRWLSLTPDAREPAERSLALAERSGDANLIAVSIEREAARAEGDERARWLLRLADLQENRLANASAAIASYERAAAAAANDERIRAELEEAYRRAGRLEDLRASMRGRVASQPTEEARVTLLRSIASLCEDELFDREGARDAHRAILALEPTGSSLDWLLADARASGVPADVIPLLEAKLASVTDDGALRAQLGLELASLLDVEGGDPKRAQEVLEAVRAAAPEPKEILEHLLRLYHVAHDLPNLGAVYAELLDHEPDERRAVELAKNLHELATKSLDSEPLTARALAKWSALAPSEKAPLEALVLMHRKAGRLRDAGEALLELGKRLDSPSEAEAKVLEASDAFEEGGDLEAAMSAANLARNLGFGSVRARDRLEAVAEKANRFDVVLQIAEGKANDATKAGPRAAAIEALLHCASIAQGKLHDIRRAEPFLLKANELAEGDTDLVARVEAAAKELDAGAKDAGAMLEHALVKRLVEKAKVEEGAPRVQKLVRAARIMADALADFDGAYKLLVESTEEENEPELLASLVDVAARGAKVKALDDLLQKRFDDSVDGDVAKRLLEVRAELLERVNRAADAAEVLKRLYGMRNQPEVRERLLATLARAGKHDDRVQVLEQAMRRATKDEEKLALVKAIARIFEVDLGNRLEATDTWKRAARIGPSDPEVLEALDRMGLKRMSMPPPARPSMPPPPAPEPAAPVPAVRASVPPPPKLPSIAADEVDEVLDADDELEELDADEVPDHVPARVSLPPPPPPPPPGRKPD